MPRQRRRSAPPQTGDTTPPDPEQLNRLLLQATNHLSRITSPGLQHNLKVTNTLDPVIGRPARRCFNLAASAAHVIRAKPDRISAWEAARRYAADCRNEARTAASAAHDAGLPHTRLKFVKIDEMAEAARANLDQIINMLKKAKKAGIGQPFRSNDKPTAVRQRKPGAPS